MMTRVVTVVQVHPLDHPLALDHHLVHQKFNKNHLLCFGEKKSQKKLLYSNLVNKE